MEPFDVLKDYHIVWTDQSKNSGDSMPLGGFDTGCNVWVENNELFLYFAKSGAFDEQGQMLKAGRLRITFKENVFREEFSQELRLETGDILICGKDIEVHLWADVSRSTVHVEISSKEPIHVNCAYEIWREGEQVLPEDGRIVFYHRNQKSILLEERLEEQGIGHLREYYPDVEKNRTSGGILLGSGMRYMGNGTGRYMNHGFKSYILGTEEAAREIKLDVLLHVAQTDTVEAWTEELFRNVKAATEDQDAHKRTLTWWDQFWKRSYVYIKPEGGSCADVDWQVGRNYQTFRYMLAANAYGEFPTKFNGGLFTVDAESFVSGHKGSPDWRDWEGIMFTAQNQRLVYWGMIKSGDFDMMKPAFEFYKRIVKPTKKRTEHFFGLKDSACYCEQIDANGLSAYYGKYGVDYPLQVRHHYVEALEFCFMILKYHETSRNDISEYIDFIMSVLNFYDYQYCELDARGKRIIYPSTALETYHAAPIVNVYGKAGVEANNYNDAETAVTNPADVIAALRDVIQALCGTGYISEEIRERLQKLDDELPEIPLETKKGHLVIAPCEFPEDYVKGNCEIPQLNTVYPYNTYGINKPDLKLAQDTYYYAWDEEDQLSHISWHPNGIYAARAGLTQEAVKYMRLKLGDSGRKFPAFWGPGHDYTPDHNWGGSGMIGVQEMLMQNLDGKIYLLPAWDLNTDVSFKLWADSRTEVTCNYKDGVLTYSIMPEMRKKDVILPKEFQ